MELRLVLKKYTRGWGSFRKGGGRSSYWKERFKVNRYSNPVNKTIFFHAHFKHKFTLAKKVIKLKKVWR